MKKLLAGKFEFFDQKFFKQLFFQNLSSTVQRNLFHIKNKLSLDETTKLADIFVAILSPESPSVLNVTAKQDTQLTELVYQLSL